ncbi:DNA-binding response regulator, OmpR family, contains REC and winged-helix (wHTH) domain [Thermoanaerobacter thermohydrosulfuricus]|uniref:Stage 0 sporulation protein A homolog n=3 Tax=Thermoanaerobacter TaxID=1754 RepID=I8R3M4_9THEO|nr:MULTISPECIES: response regulator transcription factor [Thermoanaerobacter]HHY79444.1 response regulator transcription factor [Thermoanaerobacter sp.]EIV99984.1 response regulator with CheY-like receiver domain and winged-helix DNA-binding domain [Thermoanaerobacter siderophilus SR4]EMT39869.1 two component transcriptional regulator, winged-helix family [Thermoanaerobacter thermohydrosulfuricus WC1]SDF55768.1 DNA-binding response regulator, OmpR family, contains REC and winged-helix (wHTH) do
MHKILVIEDDVNIAKFVKINLDKYYETEIVHEGEKALYLLERERFSVIVLDIMLPDISGFELLKKIRAMKVNTPVIILTAKSQDVDKILGLELGADDYITKPFNPRELVARVRAVIRRVYEFNASSKSINLLEYDEIKLDLIQNKAFVRGKEVFLTPREFQILKMLMTNRKKVVKREELIASIWGDSFIEDTKTLDVHIRRLREKIEVNPDQPKYIHTQWGVGYYFGGN